MLLLELKTWVGLLAIQKHFIILKVRYSGNMRKQLHEIVFLSMHPCCWKPLWLKADFLHIVDRRFGPIRSYNSAR